MSKDKNDPTLHITITRDKVLSYQDVLVLFPSNSGNKKPEEAFIEESGKSFWERRRRHPEYIKLCEGL